jgi:hypothetical protein
MMNYVKPSRKSRTLEIKSRAFDGKSEENKATGGAVMGSSEADIISISGCKDDQTSADVTQAGRSVGAMSMALLNVLRANKEPTLLELLTSMRNFLKKQFEQIPQLSTGHHINPNSKFYI